MSPAGRAPSEHVEQTKVVARFRSHYPDDIIFAVPNGGGRTKTDASRLKNEGVLAGVPDLVVPTARGGYHGLYVEMKRRTGGRVSEAQRRVLDYLQDQGYFVTVANGADEAWDRIQFYMQARKTRVSLRARRI